MDLPENGKLKRGRYSAKLSNKKSGLIDRDLPVDSSDGFRDKLDENLRAKFKPEPKTYKVKLPGGLVTKIPVKIPVQERPVANKRIIRGLLDGNGLTNGIRRGLINGNGLTNGSRVGFT
ncbi:MAG: hypothetical protein KAJ51_07145, partial [Thermoplasmata archaeon]|nr:hypothetical protein [Thermoplasmata archaeon]